MYAIEKKKKKKKKTTTGFLLHRVSWSNAATVKKVCFGLFPCTSVTHKRAKRAVGITESVKHDKCHQLAALRTTSSCYHGELPYSTSTLSACVTPVTLLEMLRHAPVDAVSYFCYRVSRTEEPRTGHWVSVVNICRWIRETTVHLGGEERSSRTLGCAGCRWVDIASAIDTSDRRSRCIPDLFGGSAVDHLAESGAR